LGKWTHWDLNPGPSACEADVIPLHHVPIYNQQAVHKKGFAAGLTGRDAGSALRMFAADAFARPTMNVPHHC
jgi:hypothetical protein